MTFLKSLSSVFVSVEDPGRAESVYTNLLGRAPVEPAVFQLGRTRLILRTGSGSEGLAALGFATPSLESWLTEPGRPELSPRADRLDRSSFAVLRPSSRGVPILLSEGGERPEDPGAVDPSAVAGIDHVVVLSKDLEATRALYEDALGLRLALDRSFEERGTRLLFFRVGDTTVEIGGKLGVPPEPDAEDVLWGIAYRVGNVDGAKERLSSLGFDLSDVRAGRKPGTRVCSVRGPTAGVPTLLIEPVTRESRAQGESGGVY